jgi:hypothetical protein
MKDENYVQYQVQINANTAQLQITPMYNSPPENTTTPILQLNDSKYTASGGLLVTWTDVSGTSYRWPVGGSTTAFQYNPVNQPTVLTNNLNGHAVMRFGGAGQFLSLSNFVMGGNLTIFIVAANQRATIGTQNIDTLLSNVPSGGTVAGVAINTYNYYGSPATRQLGADYSGANTPTLQVDGSSTLTLSQGVFKVLTYQITAVQAHNFAYVGMYTDGQWGGQNDIAEIIVYQGLLSSGQISTVQASLQSKYGGI